MAGCAVVFGGLIAAALAAADAPPATAPPPPSMDMLLYLAEFGDAEDRHVDPAEVAAQLEGAKTNDTAPNDERRPNHDADAPPPVDR